MRVRARLGQFRFLHRELPIYQCHRRAFMLFQSRSLQILMRSFVAQGQPLKYASEPILSHIHVLIQAPFPIAPDAAIGVNRNGISAILQTTNLNNTPSRVTHAVSVDDNQQKSKHGNAMTIIKPFAGIRFFLKSKPQVCAWL